MTLEAAPAGLVARAGRSVKPFASTADTSPRPRIVVLSRRGLGVERWQCCGLEFEDVIASIDDVEIVTPVHTVASRRLERPIRGLSRVMPYALLPRTDLSATPRHPRYDMLFVQVGNVGDLLTLDAIRGWRKRCDLAVCFVQEMFLSYLPKLGRQLNVLKQFDIVFCGCAMVVEALSERLGRPVAHLPHGIDAIHFRPVRKFEERVIDVTMIGRRSTITHEALLDHARRTGAFYFHDTTSAPKGLVGDPAGHRALIANVIKNSRFFIANKANFDRLDKIGFQEEIGARFFEGAAGGAVLLGDHPRTEAFERHFGWEDSVLPIPIDCLAIGDVVAELNGQPRRLEQISRRNVANCLLRHDWYYRWKTVLDSAELALTPAAEQRAHELSRLAASYGEGLPSSRLGEAPASRVSA